MYAFQNRDLPLSERVNDLISRLTLEEKIGLISTSQKAVSRLGLGEYHVGGEGAHGLVVRNGGHTTVFPQPYGLSMTWDTALLKKIGGIIGDEARYYYQQNDKKAFLTLWFPTIDMERDPRWGRNEEAYGEDPFLAGKLAASLIRGTQGEDKFYIKCLTAPKHFYANNYEYGRGYVDSVMSEKLKREYYLRVFEYAFREGGALSVMTAYNKVNGTPAMLNPELNTIVRGEWGCEGYFVCDGGAFSMVVNDHKTYETHAETLAAALKAGLDCMVDKYEVVAEAARDAIERGLVTEADFDTALSHTLAIRCRLGHFDVEEKTYDVSLCSEQASATAKQAALESVVLLKNDGILPLDKAKTKKIAVIGQLANENQPDWYSGNPPYEITPLDGIKKAFPNASVEFTDGCDLATLYSEADGKWIRVSADGSVSLDGDGTNYSVFRVYDWGYKGFAFRELESGKYLTTTMDGEIRCDSAAVWGWFTRELFFRENGEFVPERTHGKTKDIGVATGRGGSVYDKPYSDGGAEKVNSVLTKLTVKTVSDGIDEAEIAVKDADAVVLVVGNHTLIGARECIDRDTLDLPDRWQKMLRAVTLKNENTVLCVISGFPYAMEKEAGLSRAVIHTSHGAQEVGSAVGAVLSGEYNPAGRLSMTWYKDMTGFPDINDYDIVKNKMTYLYTDKEVLYPFGYGLSYTAFEYANLTLEKSYDGLLLSFDLKNAGERDGDEVVQVYFAQVNPSENRPIKQLAGYERVHLKAGEKTRVRITVAKEEFRIFDAEENGFVIPRGAYTFFVGGSSADIRLRGEVSI
ncbi:glucan 1,4-alpha-glucosidase [Clostridia bacterium]|nr:glucan 1,4-alpha-glucosidase [Clostridia bacterium]